MRKLKTFCLIGLLCALGSNLFAQNDTIPETFRETQTFNLSDLEQILVGCPPSKFRRSFSAIGIQFFNLSAMGADFSNFENALGVENTEILNRAISTYNIGVDYFHRGFNAMFQFGIPFSTIETNNRADRDRTINIRTRTTSLGLQVGYRIIDIRHFFIRPDVALNYYRIRLTNGERRSVYLDDFVNNRDLDIRFHQLTGYSGLTFAYRFPASAFPQPLYFTLSGGYHFRVNNSPWIRSAASRIRTNDRINVSYGFSVGFVRVVRSWF